MSVTGLGTVYLAVNKTVKKSPYPKKMKKNLKNG